MKILALLSTIVILSGCSGTSDEQSYNNCDVYTYFNETHNSFSGLVYLDKDLEMILTSQIPNHSNSDSYCWYIEKSSLIGKLVVGEYKPSVAYIFENKSTGWSLIASNDVINLPAHQ
jgi:hypothetical protein